VGATSKKLSSKYFHEKHIEEKKLGRQQKHHVGNFERAKYHPIVHEMGPSKEKQKLQKD